MFDEGQGDIEMKAAKNLEKKLVRMIKEGDKHLQFELNILRRMMLKVQSEPAHIYNLKDMINEIEDQVDDMKTAEQHYF
jgi:hypothetical protein